VLAKHTKQRAVLQALAQRGPAEIYSQGVRIEFRLGPASPVQKALQSLDSIMLRLSKRVEINDTDTHATCSTSVNLKLMERHYSQSVPAGIRLEGSAPYLEVSPLLRGTFWMGRLRLGLLFGLLPLLLICLSLHQLLGLALVLLLDLLSSGVTGPFLF